MLHFPTSPEAKLSLMSYFYPLAIKQNVHGSFQEYFLRDNQSYVPYTFSSWDLECMHSYSLILNYITKDHLEKEKPGDLSVLQDHGQNYHYSSGDPTSVSLHKNHVSILLIYFKSFVTLISASREPDWFQMIKLFKCFWYSLNI